MSTRKTINDSKNDLITKYGDWTIIRILPRRVRETGKTLVGRGNKQLT